MAGKPFEESDQDSYEALMTMEDKEIRFWDSVNKIPNNIEEEEWEKIRADYHIRLAKMKVDGISKEKEMFDTICKNLKPIDFQVMTETGDLYRTLADLFYIDDETGMLISNKWSESIYPVSNIFDYLEIVKERELFINTIEGDYSYDDKFNMWLNKDNCNEFKTEYIDLEDDKPILITEPVLDVVQSNDINDDEWNF
jgi:hypothetical protein